MSSKINAVLGLKPATRKRNATHSAGIVSHAQCPRCGGRHVVEHAVHGIPQRLCGFCGHVWEEQHAKEERRD